MKSKKIYVKDEFRIKKFNCVIYDKNLKQISIISKVKGYINLYNIINVILKSSSTKHFSYAINSLINYNTQYEEEKELKDKAIYTIWLLNENNNLDFEKCILNIEYKMDKKEITYSDDENVFSKEIINLPYKSYFKEMNKSAK